jgi:hypothetical protein
MPKPTPKTKRRRSDRRPSADAAAPRTASFGPPWAAPAALALFTLALWIRSLAVPIHEWDDSVYLFRDARLDRFTLEHLRLILTQPFYANFHPLTTLTYAFDRVVWGTWVPGFHITQLLFYAGGVLGLYFLFERLLRSRAAALAGAAIYAAHTIHVESVAWLASRKDVVCLFFYAPALLAYIRYRDEPGRRRAWYIASLLFATAAMFSKGYAVILPAALLAYDFCFTGRIDRRNVTDKIPFFVVAAVAVYLTVQAQGREGALVHSSLEMSRRVALLAKVLALYAGRSLLPVDLSAFYTIAAEPLGLMPIFGFLVATALVAAFLFLRRDVPAAAFGIALFALPLATVMNVYFRLPIWMADRYLFLPTVGSTLALVAVGSALARSTRGSERPRGGARRGILPAAAVLVIALYSALTFARIGLWTSRVALWSDVVRKELHLGGSGPVLADDIARVTNLRFAATTPISSLARAYEVTGNVTEGKRINELLAGAAGGAGGVEGEMTLAQKDLAEGRPAEAVRRLQPIASGGSWLSPLATMWIGVAEGQLGNREAGRQTILRGVELYRKTGQPATDGLLSAGGMEFNRGNYAEAATWYGLAVRESPREANPNYYFARALEEQGKLPEAMAIYKRIVSGELPTQTGSTVTLFDVYLQMGSVEQKQGDLRGAIPYAEEALRRSPDPAKREEVRIWVESLRANAR